MYCWFCWPWTNKEEVKRKREAQLPWELRGAKEEGLIKRYTWMNKQIPEKMREIPVLFTTSVLTLLLGVQATAVNGGDNVWTWRAWKRILQKPKLILKKLDQLLQAQWCPPKYQHSTLSLFPWEIAKCSIKNLDFGACKIWAHMLGPYAEATNYICDLGQL